MKIRLKVTPNAQKNKIIGWIDDSLKIKIAAQPQKGKANKELIKFLAKEWGISRSNILILKGKKSRTKLIQINDINSPPLPPKPLKLL